MTFNNLFTLFIFIPASVLLYYLLPKILKPVALFLCSLVFYAWGGLWNLLILLLVTACNYFTARELADCKERGNEGAARVTLLFTVALNVGVLLLFKYTSLTFPLGISFYMFSALSYLLDIWYGRAQAEKNPFTFLLYMTFFPKIISGPIVQFHDFQEQVLNRPFRKKHFGAGLQLFLFGLYKKVLLADRLGAAFGTVYAQPQMAGATAWLGMILYSLQLYFDFSGYSDMAIGLAKMFGFQIDENFAHPYLSRNVSEFWRRWHISLGAWFRTYVYIPLGGNRRGTALQIRNLMIVWILTGIWHGNTMNYVFWGIYHGLLVLLDKFVIRDRLERLPSAAGILLTDLAAFIGWVFFFNPTLGSTLGYFGKMLGGDGVGFWNGMTTFYLKENLLLLLIAAVCCGPWLLQFHEASVYRRGGVRMVLSAGIQIVLVLLCVMMLVGATYSTFLYAQF